jgi:hypothetical protein
MANGNGSGSGHVEKWVGRWVLGGGSFLAVVLGFGITVAKDAQIALEVAKQHGEELIQVESRILQLEKVIYDRTRLRYTSDQATADHAYLRRDIEASREAIRQHELEHHAHD